MMTKKRGRAKKDPNAPKKNWTSFMFFSNSKRAEIKENNPDASFGELSKLIGASFKRLSSEEKKEYEDKASQDKARYQREMAEYSPPEDSGDDSDGPKGKKKKKDANAPKKNLSAYNYYFQAKREEIKMNNPDASFGEISKLVSEQFRNLDKSDKKKWEDKAKKDKARYEAEMKAYNPSGGKNGMKGGKGKKDAKDPNAPKKNLSSYMLYSNAMRSKIKEKYPDASFGELGKIMGQKFKALSSKDKKKWEEKAAADKKRYESEMAAYNRKQVASESEEEEEVESDVESVEVEEASSDEVQEEEADSDEVDEDDEDDEDDYDSE